MRLKEDIDFKQLKQLDSDELPDIVVNGFNHKEFEEYIEDKK